MHIQKTHIQNAHTKHNSLSLSLSLALSLSLSLCLSIKTLQKQAKAKTAGAPAPSPPTPGEEKGYEHAAAIGSKTSVSSGGDEKDSAKAAADPAADKKRQTQWEQTKAMSAANENFKAGK